MKNEELKNEEMVEDVNVDETGVAKVEPEEKKKFNLKEKYEAVKNSKAAKIAKTVGVAALGVAAGVILNSKFGGSKGDDCDYSSDEDNAIDVEFEEVVSDTEE